MLDPQEVLWRNQGQTLTPELILGILHGLLPTAHVVEDASIATRVGACEEPYKGVTFQIERMSDILPELKAHHQAQWDEVEAVRDTLNPNYKYMLTCEQQGRFVQFTARRDGELIGNTGCYLYDSLHTSKRAAKEDTMYVIPTERKGLLAIRFFKYCEKQLVALGAEEITVTVKTTNRVYKLWERQGYEFAERVLSKTFTRDE